MAKTEEDYNGLSESSGPMPALFKFVSVFLKTSLIYNF